MSHSFCVTERLLTRGYTPFDSASDGSATVNAAFDVGRRFFDLQRDRKNEGTWSGNGMWRGYQPLPEGDVAKIDLVERFEAFAFDAGSPHGSQELVDLHQALGRVLESSISRIETLIVSAASARGIAAVEARTLWIEGHATTVVLNHYPAGCADPIAMKPHQDFGGITLIFFENTDSASVLEFKEDRAWRPLDTDVQACVVVGQLLAGWLGCPAPMHRVRRSAGGRRTLVVFHQPALARTIPFLDGRRVHAGEHITARQAEYNALDARYTRGAVR